MCDYNFELLIENAIKLRSKELSVLQSQFIADLIDPVKMGRYSSFVEKLKRERSNITSREFLIGIRQDNNLYCMNEYSFNMYMPIPGYFSCCGADIRTDLMLAKYVLVNKDYLKPEKNREMLDAGCGTCECGQESRGLVTVGACPLLSRGFEWQCVGGYLATDDEIAQGVVIKMREIEKEENMAEILLWNSLNSKLL